MSIINDLVLNVATVNGSGSQSSNNIIMKSIFRMGIPVGGKNLFPSNIQGLPTWFTIRVNEHGYVARRLETDIVIAMNVETITEDAQSVRPNGVFIYNGDLKFPSGILRQDVSNYAVPFRTLVDSVTDQIKIKKLLTNMVYVGVFAELTGLDLDVLKQVVTDNFGPKKASVIEVNLKAIQAGQQWARENVQNFPYKLQSRDKNKGQLIIDGNSSAALGMINGGCTFVSWYPITPSSSLAESFQKYAEKFRKTTDGKKKFAILQAEDELSAMGMVVGAGWAGARAMTATSGPGISLMSEFAGYSYFAEIPAVIWNIQRVGPSTGLPTRTMQGDLVSCYTLSHGDTKHPLLLPGNPAECYEFGQTCFDLSERFQTLVFVLSDLDIGINFWTTPEFPAPTKAYDRGKIVTAEDLEAGKQFFRYKDVDGDGIPYRTLPGTRHPSAPYFTRGSGHNEKAQYTEKSEDYRILMDRLNKKFETLRTEVPKPIVDEKPGNRIGILAYGSSDLPMAEARALLDAQSLKTNYMRVRAIPFSTEVKSFIERHDRVYVVEQNRDGQMKQLLYWDYPELTQKLRSVLHYDGMPLYAKKIADGISSQEKHH